MKNYRYLFLLLSALFMASACDSFLDRPPMASMSDPDYWKNETHARTYSYAFYERFFKGYGSGYNYGPFWIGQSFSDDIAFNVQEEFSPIRIPESDTGWGFGTVRKINYMLSKVEGMTTLSDEAKNHWIGVSRFFRAAEYSTLTFTYGDVPWYDRVPETDEKEYLYKDRDARIEVVKNIIEDFRFAMDNVRADDGDLNVNKYVVAGMASRLMLREGTFLKYHNIDPETAKSCLTLARDAARLVMDSKKYAVSDSYNALFSSDDLMGNREVIFYRKYLEGILVHSVLTYSNTEPQTGATRSLLESYLNKNGLPVHTKADWKAVTANDFFKDRDPRLTRTFRSRYYIRGENCAPFAYSTSGYSQCKFMDDTQAGNNELKYLQANNVTDAPVLRLGEVLLNYAEATYELGLLTQTDLDETINLLRARKGMELPPLQTIGGQPAVNGKTYDDPKRDPDVPALLWEIRRERRVELCFEGFRFNDLKRWHKLDYMYNGVNPEIRYGAYIRYSDYPKANKTEIYIENGAAEGFILCNRGTERKAPEAKHYVRPVPSNEIQLYKDNGFTLTQTKEWTNEQ